MSIKINLDSILESRNITIRELSEAIDITPANISYLGCEPGDILVYEKDAVDVND